jgi:hypothetical protein
LQRYQENGKSEKLFSFLSVGRKEINRILDRILFSKRYLFSALKIKMLFKYFIKNVGAMNFELFLTVEKRMNFFTL